MQKTRQKPIPVKKTEEVTKLVALLKGAKVLAISPMSNLPSSTLQETRKKLRGKAEIKIVKLSLLKRALKEVNSPDLNKLEQYFEGPIALITTQLDSFKLYAFLKKSKSKASAKAGQIAPFDLIVPAGDTGLPPGPALGDLKKAGINARIDGSSIKVVKDSVVTKKGETITAEVAGALLKLDIKPMEIGLALTASLEDGVVYLGEVLNIDEEAFLAKLQAGYQNAINLSVNASFPTKQTIEIMLINAFNNARNLGVNAEIFDKGIIDHLLAKASMQASALNAMKK